MEAIDNIIRALISLGIALTLYFIPLFVAYIRKHSQIMPIAIVNVTLGWTVLGWIGALVWASMKEKSDD